MYSSENLYNEPEGDDESTTYLKQKVGNNSYLEADTQIYVDETHNTDIKAVNRGKLRPYQPLAPQPPTTKIPPQLPSTTINEVKPSNKRCDLRDIQSKKNYMPDDAWRPPQPLPLEPSPIIPESNTDIYYLYNDPGDARGPPPIGNLGRTRKTEESKHKQELTTFMKELNIPVITWTEPQSPSLNSDSDSRVSSESSGFVHIGCEAACSCHTAPKTTKQDCTSTATSSGFVQVDIGVDNVYETPSEQDVLYKDHEHEDIPPPIPLRLPIPSTVPSDGPKEEIEEGNLLDCSKQLKASLKEYERKLDKIIKMINNDRSPHSHSKKADANLTLEPDTDDGYEEIDNDNGEAGPSRTDESVPTKHSNDDGILPSSHRVDTTSPPQCTSEDIPNKESEILSDASVSKTSSRVLIKESNEEGMNDTIEDHLNCDYHYNTVPKEVVEQRRFCGNTEQNNNTLMTEKSNDMHDELRQLQNKRRAIEERNMIDKAKIDEKAKINSELKQSVDYKRKLALLDEEESSLESEIQTIPKLGLGDSIEERQLTSYETRTIEEETDTLYFARIARRNSSRLGFRRCRSGSPFTRLSRQSIGSQSTCTVDSGLGQGTYYA